MSSGGLLAVAAAATTSTALAPGLNGAGGAGARVAGASSSAVAGAFREQLELGSPSLCSQTLEYTLMIPQAESKPAYTKIHLRDVPLFLIRALERIDQEGMDKEGIFRKPGNTQRLKSIGDVFRGDASVDLIPIHDLCSLIKKFFAELSRPLICGDETERKLIELATQYPSGEFDHCKLCVLFEPIVIHHLKGGARRVDIMPQANIGTLGYLMRKLKKFSEHSHQHGMTVENLATCFAPNLFPQDTGNKAKRKDKTSTSGVSGVSGGGGGGLNLCGGSEAGVDREKLLLLNERRIAVVKILIMNAEWIGHRINSYLASGESGELREGGGRSCSEHPSGRRPLIESTSLANGLSGAPRKASPQHRSSLKYPAPPITNLVEDKRTSRRSSSTMRSVVQQAVKPFANAIEKVRRRSEERKTINKDRKRDQSPQMMTPLLDAGRSRGRSPKRMLEISNGEVVQAPLSEKRHPRKPSTRQPTPGPNVFLVSSEQQPARLTVTTTSTGGGGGGASGRAGTATVARTASSKSQQAPQAPPTHAPPSQAAGTTAINGSRDPSVRIRTKKLKDEPVSMLGEEYINPKHRHPPERRRRHTTPVKIGTALRRNQPNSLHSGLKGPVRRATLNSSGDDNKENTGGATKKRRSFTADSPSTSSEDETGGGSPRFGHAILYPPGSTGSIGGSSTGGAAAAEGATTTTSNLLEIKGIEARQRRAKRQKRKESTSSVQTVAPPGAAAAASTFSPSIATVSSGKLTAPNVASGPNSSAMGLLTPTSGEDASDGSPLFRPGAPGGGGGGGDRRASGSPNGTNTPGKRAAPPPPAAVMNDSVFDDDVHMASDRGSNDNLNGPLGSPPPPPLPASTPPQLMKPEMGGKSKGRRYVQPPLHPKWCRKVTASSRMGTPKTYHAQQLPLGTPKTHLAQQLSLDSALGASSSSASSSPRLQRASASRVPLSPGTMAISAAAEQMTSRGGGAKGNEGVARAAGGGAASNFAPPQPRGLPPKQPTFAVPAMPVTRSAARAKASASSSKNSVAPSSPLSKKGSSMSVLEKSSDGAASRSSSISSRRQKSVGDSDFKNSDELREAILTATTPSALPRNMKQNALRPSVAQLANRGVVAARVSHFTAMDAAAVGMTTPRSQSALSSRPSLDTTCSVGSECSSSNSNDERQPLTNTLSKKNNAGLGNRPPFRP